MQLEKNEQPLSAPAPLGLRGFLRRKAKMLRWMFYPVFGLGLVFFFSFVWLSTVGLPDFATRQIAQELNSLGFKFSAQKLKLSWNLGVQASGLTLSQDREGTVDLYLEDAVLNIGYLGALRGESLIDSISIRHGRLEWPLGERVDDVLRLEQLSGMMMFDEKEQSVWTLKNLRGKLLNMEIHISGELINSQALSDIRFKKNETDPEALLKTKRFVLKILDSLKTFSTHVSPKLILSLYLDAADWMKSSADLIFDVQDVHGQYGVGDHFQVQLALSDLANENVLRTLKLKASLEKVASTRLDLYLDKINLEGALHFTYTNLIPQTFDLVGNASWVSNRVCYAHNFHLDLHAERMAQTQKDIQLGVNVAVDNFLVHGVGGAEKSEFHTEIKGDWDFEKEILDLFKEERFKQFDLAKYQELLNHPDFPKQIHTSFLLSHPHTLWGKLDWVDADVTLANREPAQYEQWNTPEYGPWRWAIPLLLKCELDLGGVNIPQPLVRADQLSLALDWDAPNFSLKKLHSNLHHGELDLAADLNIETRLALGKGEMDFNAHRLAHLLDAAGQRWIKQFGWEENEPPLVSAQAKVKLAPWTQLKPDWKHEVLPSLELKGHVQGTNANFKGVPVLTADGDFCLTNSLWTLPAFKVTRPEGEVVFYYEGDSNTQDYLWDFKSGCNPKVLGPILGEGAQKALDMFEFTSPPEIQAKLWGRWKDLSKSGLDATLNVKDFVFRAQPLESVSSHVTFTNGFVRAVDTVLKLPPIPPPFSTGEGEQKLVSGQEAKVAEVTFSSPEQKVTITNALCHLYPRIVTRMIGPVTDRAMQSYHFTEPPFVTVNGMIPVDEAQHSYMDFEITQGVGLQWWKMNPQNLTGTVQWQGQFLCLTNIAADFYQGKLNGWAAFDFAPEKDGSDFKFDASFNDCELKPFINSFNTKSNHLEGLMDGQLTVTSANTADWKSWQGHGSASITDGLIWDIPVFGLFSGILNEISPGLGNSQASRGGGTFTITNSVVRTDDLEIASPTFQMLYKGTIDFERNLDAHVDIDILKGWGDVGKIINFATTPFRRVFRCSVSGTFEKPSVEFVYIPKPIMMLVRPLKTFKDLFGLNKVKEVDEEELDKVPSDNSSQ